MFRRMYVFSLLGIGVLVVSVLAAGQPQVITQKDKTFSAADLTIHHGETVIFKNEDDVAHNVFSQTPGLEFNTKTQAPGTEAQVTFKQPGTAEVRCAIHPKMKTLIHVQ